MDFFKNKPKQPVVAPFILPTTSNQSSTILESKIPISYSVTFPTPTPLHPNQVILDRIKKTKSTIQTLFNLHKDEKDEKKKRELSPKVTATSLLSDQMDDLGKSLQIDDCSRCGNPIYYDGSESINEGVFLNKNLFHRPFCRTPLELERDRKIGEDHINTMKMKQEFLNSSRLEAKRMETVTKNHKQSFSNRDRD